MMIAGTAALETVTAYEEQCSRDLCTLLYPPSKKIDSGILLLEEPSSGDRSSSEAVDQTRPKMQRFSVHGSHSFHHLALCVRHEQCETGFYGCYLFECTRALEAWGQRAHTGASSLGHSS